MDKVEVKEEQVVKRRDEIRVGVESKKQEMKEDLWRKLEQYLEICKCRVSGEGDTIVMRTEKGEIRMKKDVEGVRMTWDDVSKIDIRLETDEKEVIFEIGKIYLENVGDGRRIQLELILEMDSKELLKDVRYPIYLIYEGNEAHQIILEGALTHISKREYMKVNSIERE